MAPRLTLNSLLLGSTLIISMTLGSALLYGLFHMSHRAQETNFIDRAHEDLFDFAEKFNNSVDSNDANSITEFLDHLLLRVDINYAGLKHNGQIYNSSLGRFNNGEIKLDQHIGQHQDDTLFLELALGGPSNNKLIIGFDEQPINHVINEIQAQSLLFVIAYTLTWLIAVVLFQNYLKARINILIGMASDISQGLPLYRRKFLVEDLDILAQSIIEMEHQLRIREDDLRYLVSHDALTKVPNRRHFNSYLSEALNNPTRSAPLSLILIDIDKFKQVNDTYGHVFGDRLIRYVASSLQRIAGNTGISSRIGGDEFAIIYYYENDIQLDAFCRQIHKKISRTVLLGGTRINVSLSMGIATCLPDELDISIERMVHRADMALYQSKRNNIPLCYHDESVIKENHRFKEIMHCFQNGSFKDPTLGIEVYFQPKYSLTTGQMSGVEALTRWFHNSLGYIEARDVVEAAATVNMLDQFTDVVIEQSISALTYWRQNGLDTKVAINIPPSALSDADFGIKLNRKLASVNLKPTDIELEITEHTALAQDEAVYELLHSLKEQGFSIAIDDFGVGYANFRNLRNYPFSTLKIDRDFVSEILLNPRDKVIVQATAQIAKDLSMVVVAEGIENASSIPTLRALGCEYGQGYLFSKAVTQERILELANSSDVSEQITAL